jgi:cyclopropane fatty-acyl-phospholipid synthase-like methyltransferase
VTKDPKSFDVESIVALYRHAFQEHGNSSKALLDPKGRIALRFERLCASAIRSGMSVLDFGCGLADLKSFLEATVPSTTYFGVDIVEEFILENSRNYGAQHFKKIENFREIGDTYDAVIISGAFNLLYSENVDEHKKIVRDALAHLFDHARVSLAVNFMTDAVDYQQSRAFHQNVEEIYSFARDRLSPRLILDQSYMPYEFTLTLFKDQVVQRPENIYRSLE